jgi:hypothetical protein
VGKAKRISGLSLSRGVVSFDRLGALLRLPMNIDRESLNRTKYINIKTDYLIKPV